MRATTRPRVKASRRPVLIGTGLVRVGGLVHKLAFDVADLDGWFWALVNLLDGTRTVAEVTTALRADFPHRPAEHVAIAVEALVLFGHLEDADEPEPLELTRREQERYGRGRELFRAIDTGWRSSSWAAQLALKDAAVVVLGVGGVGSVVAQSLTAFGVGRVHCVDDDVVALSDLGRQSLYTQQDVARPKVEAAVHRLRALNSDIVLTGERRRVEGPAALAAVVAGFDVVVLAADSPPELRSWTNSACIEAGTRWVWGGYDGPLMTVGLYRPGTGPCYDCAKTAERERKAALPARTGRLPRTGELPPHAANFTTVTITGSFAANAVISLLTGAPRLPANRIYQFNLVNLMKRYVIGPNYPHPRCPVCGVPEATGDAEQRP